MESKVFSIDIGGRTLSAEFNSLAEKAHGSCLLRYGNSALLATVVMAKEERLGASFLPLTVDYEEKFYAAGAILGSRYQRREGRPSEQAVLSGRMLDRTIRPLFPKNLRKEVQVIITVLAIDEDDPDVLSIIAASLALSVSHIPWSGPVSALRLGKTDKKGSLIINPRYAERGEKAFFDLVVCGKGEDINMIEMEGTEVSEVEISASIAEAIPELVKIQKFQEKIIKEIGKEKEILNQREISKDAKTVFKEEIESILREALLLKKGSLEEVENTWVSLLKNKLPEENLSPAREYFENQAKNILRSEASRGARFDGRKLDELRDISISVGEISPVLHGTGTFFRGDTHVLSVLTLGGPKDSLFVDNMEAHKTSRRFMHHYNFPPFSSGETGRVGGTNRRMVGHGALAEKALEKILPPREKFPYTIRLVSECLTSDGSTSMASVSASTLALMDGGVPITKPVAGIAIGLLEGLGGEKILLTDIAGHEDHYGDMDFKVAGTSEGITAIQLDVKISGVTMDVIKEALSKGRDARKLIIQKMLEIIPASRNSVSPRAPRILTLSIRKDQIGMVIGSQGKTVRDIQETTGAEVTVEDDGTIFILGRNREAEKALKEIEELVHEYKKGEKRAGIVTKITDFGVFIKIGRGGEGLLHVSDIDSARAKNISEHFKEGGVINVEIKDVDERGRINLVVADE